MPDQQQQQQCLCAECGQAFASSDRLAKHVAGRHRRRPTSSHLLAPNELAAGGAQLQPVKPHPCTVCPKSFGRSDMLTRHMRLHTGIK